MQRKSIFFAIGLGVLSLVIGGLGTPAQAQNATSGAIQGVVTDQATGESLAGVTVVVTSTALQGTQSAITEGSGSFKITNLPPGTYVVTFYYSDITVRRTNNLVNINKTTPVYQKIDTAQAGGEVITIEDKAPSIDPTSTTQGITLDQDYTKNIPIPGRTFEDALGAAAGSAGDDLGVSFSGSTSLENSYVVDGINTTGLTFGTVGSPVINNFIEEIEIITGGYNAEYGRATGGVVNVVTKSGSNEFHGEVFTNLTPGFLVAIRDRTPVQSSSIDAEANLAYDADFGFSLGGPIIKDKVWFFVGFAPQLIKTNVDRITKRRTDCRVLQPDGNLSECVPEMFGDGTYDEDPNTGFFITEELSRQRIAAEQASYQFVSKVNFAVAPEHQGQVTLIGTPRSGQTAGVFGEPAATRFDFTDLTTDLAGKWTSKLNNNKTEIEAVVGWHRATFEADSIDNSRNDDSLQRLRFGNLAVLGRSFGESMATINGCDDSRAEVDVYPFIENCPDDGIGYAVGGPGSLSDEIEQRYSARVSATQRVKAFGNHEIKAGLDAEDNRLNKRRIISGDVFYDVFLPPFNQTVALRWIQLGNEANAEFDDVCNNGTMGETAPCNFLGPTDVEGQTFNWSAYLRDSWQILPNLTLNAGMRYEEQRLRFAKELQDTLDPLTGRELGKNAMIMRNMWAPRLGLLYDWTKEGRSKVYGHWGRFYESIPMDINDRSFGGETLYQQVYDGSAQCGPPTSETTGSDPNMCSGNPAFGSTIFGTGVLVAPGIKPQYMDEVIVGVEYEVLEDLKVGVSLHNRRMGRVIEDVSTDAAETYILANPGEFPGEEENRLLAEIAGLDPATQQADIDRLTAELEQFRGIRIFDKPRRDYNAFQLTATKRFSRNLFMQSSYTYATTRGNYPGLYSADNGQVDPNITSQYDLIELLANRDGPLPQDRPHYFKLDGYYTFDLKQAGTLTTGTRFRALSGTPVNALGRHYLYGFDESFVLPRGALGRTDFEISLDLHVGYRRKLNRGMSVEVFTDLFNVFNNQGEFRRDATYTFDRVNPIVGGEFEDLIFAKAQSPGGLEENTPVGRNLNFLNTTTRYTPFFARIGARLTF